MTKMTRRPATYLAPLVASLAVMAMFAPTVWGQSASPSNIDTDEQRADPVPHRFIHGDLGGANFQIALPNDWNGRLLIGARGFSGNEFSTGAFKDVGLEKGYAYALSDQGWNRFTINDEPSDQYFESQRRILQLTRYTKSTVKRHYGEFASRTYMVGGSNGGHNAKWMVEDYPNEYDGALAWYGISSHLEWMRSNARFLRNYDVFEPRINDIIDARTADPDWDPTTDPLDPPLSPAQVEALLNIYEMPAVMKNGTTFDIGRPPGSEYRWPGRYNSLLGYLRDSVAKMDPFYDPDGDGELSREELKMWDPDHSSPAVHNDLRRKDLTGKLERPIIIAHGTHDIVVSQGETDVYKRMVENHLGTAGSLDVLAVYYVAGAGHGGPQFTPLVAPGLDALEAWVDYRESAGDAGSPPPDVLGGYPRDF